jgi:hypothetical protein
MKHILTLVTATSLFVLSSFTSSSQAIPINSHDEFEQTGYFYNPCTSEYIFVTWTITLNVHGIFNKNRAMFTLHNRVQGVGTGVNSGMHYIINETENINYNLPFNGSALSFTYTDRAKLISTGKSANMFLIGNSKLTINANGEISVSDSNFDIDCR